MIAVWIILSCLALLLLLLVLPVTVSVLWDGPFLIRVRYAGIPVFSNKPKKKESRKKTKKSSPSPKSVDTPEKKGLFTRWREDYGFTGATQRAAGLIKIILRRAAWFIRRLKLRKLRLRITVSASDAAQTAIRYGAVCTAVYPVLTLLFTLLDCRAKSVDISADFHAEKPEVALSLLVHANLMCAVCTALIGLWEYYKSKDVELHERE